MAGKKKEISLQVTKVYNNGAQKLCVCVYTHFHCLESHFLLLGVHQ